MAHYVAFQSIYKLLKNKLKLSICCDLHTNRKTPKLNKQSSIGTKIKYYRRLNDIRQEDLATLLNVSRDSIMAIENKNKCYYNLELLNRVVDILDIRYILQKSTTYMGFLLNNPSKQIKEYRLTNNMTKLELSRILKVHYKTIQRWEEGKTTINKRNYQKIKNLIC